MTFRPIVVRAPTSSGHSAEQYWLLLLTTTGSLADQYWSDFPPYIALDLDSADFALTEQIKGIGLPPLRRKADAHKDIDEWYLVHDHLVQRSTWSVDQGGLHIGVRILNRAHLNSGLTSRIRPVLEAIRLSLIHI